MAHFYLHNSMKNSKKEWSQWKKFTHFFPKLLFASSKFVHDLCLTKKSHFRRKYNLYSNYDYQCSANSRLNTIQLVIYHFPQGTIWIHSKLDKIQLNWRIKKIVQLTSCSSVQAIWVSFVIDFYTCKDRAELVTWPWDLSQAIIDLNHNESKPQLRNNKFTCEGHK